MFRIEFADSRKGWNDIPLHSIPVWLIPERAGQNGRQFAGHICIFFLLEMQSCAGFQQNVE